MRRSELRGAPWNPRRIDDNAKKKLKANLKRVGLLRPLVFNKRTGNIISGNQRLAIMDDIERDKDYRLDVAVVDLDEKTEEEQIVFFNNPSTMGMYDFKALAKMLPDVKLENCGFDTMDLRLLLPEYEMPMGEQERENLAAVEHIHEEINKAKQKRKPLKKLQGMTEEERVAYFRKLRDGKDHIAKQNVLNPETADAELFTVATFATEGECQEFLNLLRVEERFISGEMVEGIIAKAIQETERG